MNKNLLAIARHAGDISFSINGEAKVSFSIGGEWVNLHTATFTGDQGCVYPNRKPEEGEESNSALDAVLRTLKAISVVPYQNDSSFEQYATPEANEWLNKTLPALVEEMFRTNHSMYKLQSGYVPEGSKEPTIVVSIEVVSNEYANSFFERLGVLTFMGTVTTATIGDDGKVTYIYTDVDGNENSVTREITDNVYMIGDDSFTRVKKVYSSDNNSEFLVVTSENFEPNIETALIVKN